MNTSESSPAPTWRRFLDLLGDETSWLCATFVLAAAAGFIGGAIYGHGVGADAAAEDRQRAQETASARALCIAGNVNACRIYEHDSAAVRQ